MELNIICKCIHITRGVKPPQTHKCDYLYLSLGSTGR